MEVIWKYFYNNGSGSEPGTLFQLRNRISHTTVGKKPKSNFDAYEDFLEVVINSKPHFNSSPRSPSNA